MIYRTAFPSESHRSPSVSRNTFCIVKHIYSSKEGGFSKNPSADKIGLGNEYRITHFSLSAFLPSQIIPDYHYYHKWFHYSDNASACRTIMRIQYNEALTAVSLLQWFHFNDSAPPMLLHERFHYSETCRIYIMVSLY